MKRLYLIIFLSISLFANNSIRDKVVITVPTDISIIENKTNFIELKLVNNSNIDLIKKDNFYISYHLLDKDGKMIKFDNVRTIIDIEANSSKNLKLKIEPLDSNKYFLIIDIVKEGSYWFGYKKRYFIKVNKYFDNYKECTKNSKKTCWYIEDEDSINKLNFIIQQTLESSKKDLTNINVKGFSAGTGYSTQLWARDSYTILQSSKYYYKEPYLSSWIDYFLKNKTEDDLIYDWFDNKLNFDKNSVEVDQESSLALAYFELLKIDKNRYIDKIDEVEKLLEKVFILKKDKKIGLIINAHTIDWGDVQYGGKDWHSATHITKSTYYVAGIYTNALYYKAIEKLTTIYKNLDIEKYNKWEERTSKLKENINRYLWSKQNGFYKLHIHITPLIHPFDEDNMFGMGGNSVALSTSLVNQEKVDTIIKTAIERKKLFNFSTISGVLLPSYPKNYYTYGAVNDYFKYQNGGQWDWFGYRFVKQMFRYGFKKEGLLELRKIADKNVNNRGIYEWDTMIGEGKGSSNYTGAAGVAGTAVVEGLFGLEVDNDKIIIDENRLIRSKNFILNIKIPNSNKSIIYSNNKKCYTLSTKGFKRVIFYKKSKDNLCIESDIEVEEH